MASTAPSLPIFYNGLEPLSSETHRGWRVRQRDAAPFLVGQHAVPVTVEEFPSVGRHFPIIFSTGDEPIPLALFGLNEGVNAFVGDDGRLTEPVYVPAYVRRYPFMLAKLRPDAQELSRPAVRRRAAERGDAGDPEVQRAVRAGGPAHRRLRARAQGVRPPDGG